MRQMTPSTALAAILLAGAAAPVAAADGSARADNIDIVVANAGGASINYTIPHIEATGTPLTDAELKSLFDIGNSTSIADRLGKLTATAINIPEIDVDETLGEIDVKVVYHDVKLADVATGKIGAASIAGTTITGHTPDAGDFSGTYGALDARNLDLPLMTRLFTDARASDDEPLRPLYEAVTLDSLQLTGSKGFKMTAGKMSARDIEGRPFSTPLLSLTKTLGSIQPGAQPDAGQLKVIAGLFGDAFNSFSFGMLEMRDLAIEVSGDKPMKFSIDRIGLRDFGAGKIGEIAYDGLDMAGDGVNVRFGTLALRGLDMRPLVQALGTALAAGEDGLKRLDPRRLLPKLDEFVLANVTFDVPDQRHSGNAAGGARDQFQLGRIELDTTNYFSGIPTAFSAALDHLVMQMPANMPNPDLQQFFALGYTGIDLSMRLDLAWNEAAQEFSANEISATLADIGRVRLKAKFANVTEQLFGSEPATIQAAALGALLKSVDLFVENDGLVEKAISAEARKEGKTPDQIRQTMVTAAAVGIPAALGNGAAAKAIGNAVAKFAAQPKTLHIVARSSEGLGAGDAAQLNDPGALLSKVDVSAAANE